MLQRRRQPTEILRVEHLTRQYEQGEAQASALNDVSFRAEQGEFVIIARPSGSGKPMLLHLLGDVDRPTGGKVYVSGKDMHALDETALVIFRRRQIGLIYQFYNLVPVPNVEENITLPLPLDNRNVNTQQLDSVVEVLGLKKRSQYLSSQLSGRQQQCVSIGRALMASPVIVLVDEPTGNLDRTNSREIIDLLKRLYDELHQILITITYDEGIALQADRILKIEGGHIVRDGVIRR